MILIGQYDSPFVRRVGVALRLYDMAFEHRPLSVFADGAAIRALNPLMRVPTLVLPDGFVLTDSHMILDYLDSLAAAPLCPRDEPERHKVLKIATLATGLAEKAVSLFYERVLHDVTSPTWEARCALQIGAVLAALQADRAARPGPWWFGARMTHADIAVACALRFLAEAHPDLALTPYPDLIAHAAACEALPVFAEIAQPFVPPA
ncbi:glutathione S-transferase family protein [bacterium]|nr:glutathione S-transferase family protein [bacterium]